MSASEADHADPFEYLASPVAWVQVAEVLEEPSSLDVSPSPAARVRQVTVEGVTEGSITAHRSYWPGVFYGLEQGGTVWAAIGDPNVFSGENFVLYFLVMTPDGVVFLPGNCQAEFLYEPVQARFGERTNETLGGMVNRSGMTGGSFL